MLGTRPRSRIRAGLCFNADMDAWGLVLLTTLLVYLVLMQFSLSNLSRQQKQQAERLRALDQRIRLVMDHLGVVEPAPNLPPAVVEHLAQGRKLQAIKAYREATGVGLKEAKQAVEDYARLK